MGIVFKFMGYFCFCFFLVIFVIDWVMEGLALDGRLLEGVLLFYFFYIILWYISVLVDLK